MTQSVGRRKESISNVRNKKHVTSAQRERFHGNNDVKCKFPFIYDGKTMYSCLHGQNNKNKTWCSLTSNYDRDTRWMYCLPNDAPSLYNSTSYKRSQNLKSLSGDVATVAADLNSELLENEGILEKEEVRNPTKKHKDGTIRNNESETEELCETCDQIPEIPSMPDEIDQSNKTILLNMTALHQTTDDEDLYNEVETFISTVLSQNGISSAEQNELEYSIRKASRNIVNTINDVVAYAKARSINNSYYGTVTNGEGYASYLDNTVHAAVDNFLDVVLEKQGVSVGEKKEILASNTKLSTDISEQVYSIIATRNKTHGRHDLLKQNISTNTNSTYDKTSFLLEPYPEDNNFNNTMLNDALDVVLSRHGIQPNTLDPSSDIEDGVEKDDLYTEDTNTEPLYSSMGAIDMDDDGTAPQAMHENDDTNEGNKKYDDVSSENNVEISIDDSSSPVGGKENNDTKANGDLDDKDLVNRVAKNKGYILPDKFQYIGDNVTNYSQTRFDKISYINWQNNTIQGNTTSNERRGKHMKYLIHNKDHEKIKNAYSHNGPSKEVKENFSGAGEQLNEDEKTMIKYVSNKIIQSVKNDKGPVNKPREYKNESIGNELSFKMLYSGEKPYLIYRVKEKNNDTIANRTHLHSANKKSQKLIPGAKNINIIIMNNRNNSLDLNDIENTITRSSDYSENQNETTLNITNNTNIVGNSNVANSENLFLLVNTTEKINGSGISKNKHAMASGDISNAMNSRHGNAKNSRHGNPMNLRDGNTMIPKHNYAMVPRYDNATILRQDNTTISRHNNVLISKHKNATISRGNNATISRENNATISRENDAAISRHKNETISRQDDTTISNGDNAMILKPANTMISRQGNAINSRYTLKSSNTIHAGLSINDGNEIDPSENSNIQNTMDTNYTIRPIIDNRNATNMNNSAKVNLTKSFSKTKQNNTNANRTITKPPLSEFEIEMKFNESKQYLEQAKEDKNVSFSKLLIEYDKNLETSALQSLRKSGLISMNYAPEEIEIRTFGGNGNGEKCMFPFIYDGDTYFNCININRDKPWCSITANYDKIPVWGYCNDEQLAFPEEKKADNLTADEIKAKKLRQFADIMHNQGEEVISKHSGMKTFGGNGNGANCAFPFVYDGQTHMKCIPRPDGTSWCAVQHSYDLHPMWGNCCDNDVYRC